MKRRNLFKFGAATLASASILPSANAASKKANTCVAERTQDKWFHLGKGKSALPNRLKKQHYDVVVIGAGVAGMCAAVAAARTGAKTIIVQDRPVLGGNASSENRVNLNGVTRLQGGLPERETGIVEEILLHNRFHNPQESYWVWDHLNYEFLTREPNLTVLLNTSALEAVMRGDKIEYARCWQGPAETEHHLYADYFIDCSGDGLLAATAGAEYRTGREGKKEFNETYAPDEPDGWQMGMSLMFYAKDMGKPTPYTPPEYAIKFDLEGTHPERHIRAVNHGYWWIEVGSDDDIIADFDECRHKLMGYVHGAWDYVKNSGKFPQSANYALDWIGSFPGRRESRRFIGDYIVSERDMLEHKHFADAIGYGGWSLDEHNPGGIEDLQAPPSYFHYKFKKVYEYPFKALYSKNVPNLLFAGRNVSQTHIALSSSRIQATCALMGQAVGTASALCIQKKVTPRQLANQHINELQEQLLRDDVFIPNRPASSPGDLAKTATAIFASSTQTGDAKLLTNGMSRDFDGKLNHWCSRGLPADVQFEWEQPTKISQVEIKCDTNVYKNLMMRHDSKRDKFFGTEVPPELMKSIVIEVREQGVWKQVAATANNKTRLMRFKFASVNTTALRIRLLETYGDADAKLFEVRAYA